MEVTLSQAVVTHAGKNKKRPNRPDLWKRTISKRNRNAGEDYVSSHTGQVILAKDPPTGGKKCSVNCRLDPCQQLTLVLKQDLFRQYYSLANYEAQRTYLLSMIEKAGQGPSRASYRYYVVNNGKREEVCQVTFLDIYQISQKVVRNIHKAQAQGQISVKEGRGKYTRPNYQITTLKQQMRIHIFQQAIEPVHYSRQLNRHHFLPTNLNVTRMLNDFIQANPQIPDVSSKGWLYRQTFTETGIMLKRPRSDTCRVCDKLHIDLKVANQQQEARIRNEIHQHHLLADNGYKGMTEDIDKSKVDPNFVVKVVDMQQILFCPTLRHQDIFYMRQFACYNHCIYDGGSDIGYMYFWNETEGHRGVNELGSCLLHHLKAQYQPLNPGQQRTLTVWSDRCRGQNNNYMMVTLFIYLIKEGYFTNIEQKFLISGHSYMPCDRLFGLIEKRKRVSDAFVPDDWIRIISEAQPSRPFPVIRLQQSMIFDLKQLEDAIPRPSTFKVTEYAIIKLSSSAQSIIRTTTAHVLHPVWNDHRILAPGQTGSVHQRQLLDINQIQVVLRQCYHGLIPLSQPKKDNIRDMLSFLMPNTRLYYDNVLQI